jgi:nucleoid DNA-binding protein
MTTSLTKLDIVVRATAQTGLDELDVGEIVDKLLEHIAENAAAGRITELRNFGVFKVKVRKPRVGRNPNAPEIDVRIPARAVVQFIPGKKMREQVRKLTPPAP